MNDYARPDETEISAPAELRARRSGDHILSSDPCDWPRASYSRRSVPHLHKAMASAMRIPRWRLGLRAPAASAGGSGRPSPRKGLGREEQHNRWQGVSHHPSKNASHAPMSYSGESSTGSPRLSRGPKLESSSSDASCGINGGGKRPASRASQSSPSHQGWACTSHISPMPEPSRSCAADAIVGVEASLPGKPCRSSCDTMLSMSLLRLHVPSAAGRGAGHV
mmetsp:Transcript_21178/g.62443  ORF Transcript_21178/g.62443 Transcript_21178/m.62443 type:complete len:222 (+) Transcript_21178:75-740(+)